MIDPHSWREVEGGVDEFREQEEVGSVRSGRNVGWEGGAPGPGFLGYSLGLHLMGKSLQGLTAEIFSLQNPHPWWYCSVEYSLRLWTWPLAADLLLHWKLPNVVWQKTFLYLFILLCITVMWLAFSTYAALSKKTKVVQFIIFFSEFSVNLCNLTCVTFDCGTRVQGLMIIYVYALGD